jgi:hypothetical protein
MGADAVHFVLSQGSSIRTFFSLTGTEILQLPFVPHTAEHNVVPVLQSKLDEQQRQLAACRENARKAQEAADAPLVVACEVDASCEPLVGQPVVEIPIPPPAAPYDLYPSDVAENATQLVSLFTSIPTAIASGAKGSFGGFFRAG